MSEFEAMLLNELRRLRETVEVQEMVMISGIDLDLIGEDTREVLKMRRLALERLLAAGTARVHEARRMDEQPPELPRVTLGRLDCRPAHRKGTYSWPQNKPPAEHSTTSCSPSY